MLPFQKKSHQTKTFAEYLMMNQMLRVKRMMILIVMRKQKKLLLLFRIFIHLLGNIFLIGLKNLTKKPLEEVLRLLQKLVHVWH